MTREYDYQHHSLTDSHYHIRELFEQQDKRVEDRNYFRNRTKELEEREETLNDSKFFTITDFWCDKCKKDFKSQAIRQIEVDWSNTSARIAYYKSKCDKGHWCIRLITDKHKDPFWFRSKLCALDRGNHNDDTIQPFMTGFEMLYGKHK